MIRGILSGAVVLLAGSAIAFAAPKDDVTNAAKKLADSNNYSWKQATEGGGGGGGQRGGGQRAGGQRAAGQRRGGGGFGGGGNMEGKLADGYMILTMQGGQNSTEVIKKGSKVVIKTQDGWQTPEEMAANAGDNNGRPNRGQMMSRMMEAYRGPAEQAERLVSATKDLTKSGDAYSGDMTEEGAKEYMSFGRRGGQGGGPEISDAKGNAKFWVKDGTLSKIEYHVSGTMSINGNDREINRTITIEISDVGKTKADVPDDAKKKLS